MANLPPDTRVVGQGNPAADMDAVVDVLAEITGAQPGGSVASQRLLLTVASKTAAYTAVATDFLILCNATSGAFTVTLPSGAAAGQVYAVKKTDSSAHAITVSPASGTIDGQASLSLSTQNDWTMVEFDGTNWDITGGNVVPAGRITASLALQATTGLSGFALQNGTPTIVSWTTPNDGQMHRVLDAIVERVTSTETGGAVNMTGTDPAGNSFSTQLDAGGHAANSEVFPSSRFTLVAPNTTVSIVQSSALTVGAATVWAELWGS